MKYKWTVEFTIDATWVEDGFNLDNDRANTMIQEALPYAMSHEVRAKVLSAPSKQEIRKIQASDK